MATTNQHNELNNGSRFEGKSFLANQTFNSKEPPSASNVNENAEKRQWQSSTPNTDTHNTSATTAPDSSATDEPPSERPKPVAPADKNYPSFSHAQKLFIVLMASGAAFFSSLSANIYYPMFNILAHDFHVSNTLINLTVTVYMVSKRYKLMY